DLKNRRREKALQKLDEVQVQQYKEILQGEFVDIATGIRQSIKDMLELNEEQKNAIPEMINSLTKIQAQVEKKTDFDDKLRVDIYKAISLVNGFYFRGKLRIDSRKELGNWFDRYKEFNSI